MCTAPSAKPPAFILSSIDSNWHLGALTLPLCSGVGVRLDGLNLVRSNYSWPRFLRSFHIFCIVSTFSLSSLSLLFLSRCAISCFLRYLRFYHENILEFVCSWRTPFCEVNHDVFLNREAFWDSNQTYGLIWMSESTAIHARCETAKIWSLTQLKIIEIADFDQCGRCLSSPLCLWKRSQLRRKFRTRVWAYI